MDINNHYGIYYARQLAFYPAQLYYPYPAEYTLVVPAYPPTINNLANIPNWRCLQSRPPSPPARQGVTTESIKPGCVFWLPTDVAQDSAYWRSSGVTAHGALHHPVVAISDISPTGTVKCLLLTSWKAKGGSKGKWSKGNTDPARIYYLALGHTAAPSPNKYLSTDVADSKAKNKPLLEYDGAKPMDRHSYVDVTSAFEIEPHNLANFKGDACVSSASMHDLLDYRQRLLNSQQNLQHNWPPKTNTKWKKKSSLHSTTGVSPTCPPPHLRDLSSKHLYDIARLLPL